MDKQNTTINREKKEIVMTRVFDAPRDLVFKAYTDPNLVPQWWGVGGVTTRVDKMDMKPGGSWRYIQRDADGNEFAFNGVYREVVSPERLVYTFEWEGMPGHEILETVLFEEQDGKTKMTDISSYQTLEDLEGMLQSGAEQGSIDLWDRLAKLLETM